MAAARRKTPSRAGAPTSVDEYLAGLGPEQRSALDRLRRIIRRAVPRAEECISYQLPAFRLDGRMLVWFGAATNHCAFYPGAVVGGFRTELDRFDVSKGTVRFQPAHPIPATLVRKLVRARIDRRAVPRGSGAKRRPSR